MNRSISGRIMACWTLSSLRTTTAPLDHPENRRLFFFQGTPAPCALQPAPTTPAAFFFTASGCLLCPAINLIAFHFPRPGRFGLAGDDPWAQWLGHPLRVIRVQPSLLGDLGIR
nr:hypothetical protein [Candidatus Contendobacter odensis]